MVTVDDNLMQVTVVEKKSEMMIVEQMGIAQDEVAISFHQVNPMFTFTHQSRCPPRYSDALKLTVKLILLRVLDVALHA